jgi:hypothetical protein
MLMHIVENGTDAININREISRHMGIIRKSELEMLELCFTDKNFL